MQSYFATGMGLTIYYEGSTRLGVLPVQWLEVSLSQLSPQTAVMQAGPDSRGAVVQYLVNVNCFEHDDARKTGSANLYSLSTIVTVVSEFFMPTGSIPIMDFNTSGDPIVGALISQDAPGITSIPTPPDASITQINVSAIMSYVAEWTST
jgi:hypothetical protein